MYKIIIDTMHIEAMLAKDPEYLKLMDAIDEGKIIAMSSVVSLTELIKNLGVRNEAQMHVSIQDLKSSDLILVDVTQKIAEHAGELRIKYDIPTADSLIAATGIIENVKHILTDDEHFDPLVHLIKKTDLKGAIRMSR